MSCCKVKAILFPEPRANGDYLVDGSADYNLMGAIEDLTRTGKPGVISMKTLGRVLEQLRKAREAFGLSESAKPQKTCDMCGEPLLGLYAVDIEYEGQLVRSVVQKHVGCAPRPARLAVDG